MAWKSQKFRFNGAALKQLIAATGKPYEWVALEIGRTKESVRSYEAGRAAPSPDVVMAFAALFGCKVEDLYVPVDDDTERVAARLSRRSRSEQGLAEKVTDPAALDDAAELLNTARK